MIIYHGSKDIIEKPEFGKGNKKNDYGLGFYCTENVELAKEWACSNNETNGYANQYEIDLTDYRILDLREEKYSILNWMALLLKFRTFDVNTPISAQAKEYILEKKEAIIQKNDRHVEQIKLFVRICPGIWRITEIFLFLFGAGRCNGNFGGSGKPDDLKYSIYSYGYYTVKMENPL